MLQFIKDIFKKDVPIEKALKKTRDKEAKDLEVGDVFVSAYGYDSVEYIVLARSPEQIYCEVLTGSMKGKKIVRDIFLLKSKYFGFVYLGRFD